MFSGMIPYSWVVLSINIKSLGGNGVRLKNKVAKSKSIKTDGTNKCSGLRLDENALQNKNAVTEALITARINSVRYVEVGEKTEKIRHRKIYVRVKKYIANVLHKTNLRNGVVSINSSIIDHKK